jgi:hypothetical protein
VYLGCAIAGGTILIGQAGLSLFGLGGDTDVDADVDADELDTGDGGLSLISIRTLSAFLTLFGLVGWMGTARGWGGIPTALAAFAAGSSVMVAVAIMMQFFYKMQSKGNLDPRTAVGKTASVYLKVPAQNAGKGKITVVLQGRSEEFSAVTSGDELPTGSDCRLVEMTTDDTFRVEALG